MRFPLFKPWRAISDLDDLSDSECEAVVRDALLTQGAHAETVPWILGAITLVAWPVGILIAMQYVTLNRFVPIAADPTLAIIEMLVTTVLAGAAVALLSRDVLLYLSIRRYLARASCPKCHQPLYGLPIQSIGAEPNPANQFVRCAECGKKYSLLDLGLTPRDLVPLEQRRVDPNFGAKRGGSVRVRHGEGNE
ncbi:MAG: hypothetical protein WC718_00965 [Phycisphaerales bacterium]